MVARGRRCGALLVGERAHDGEVDRRHGLEAEKEHRVHSLCPARPSARRARRAARGARLAAAHLGRNGPVADVTEQRFGHLLGREGVSVQ